MWGNARVGTAALVRPVKRSETRISTTASPETHQAGKHNAVANSLLHFSPFICYKQSTESSSVASRAKLSATLVARPASNDSRGRESLQLSRPRDFIRKSNTVSEGYLQSKDLQKDLFSIFCLPTRAVAKTHAPKLALTRPEGHTVARIRAPDPESSPKALSFRTALS
jgi:hypothetical protein